jgi:hypothetical protein
VLTSGKQGRIETDDVDHQKWASRRPTTATDYKEPAKTTKKESTIKQRN